MGSLGGDHVDPDYFFFLQNLRVHGEWYTFEPPGDGFSDPVVVRYEKDESVSPRGKRFRGKDEPVLKVESDSTGTDSVVAQLLHSEENDNEVSDQTSRRPSESRGRRVNIVRKKTERVQVKKDGSWQVKPVKSEFDWVEEIHPSSTKYSEFTSASEPDEDIKYEIPIEILNRPESGYKKKLIEHLSSPFNKKEFKVLMKRARCRSRKVISKETRNGVRFCETNEFSKSYFDWYPDFAQEVENAEKNKQWLLLRGFFFWVQNVTSEEAFKPWVKDKVKNRKCNSAS